MNARKFIHVDMFSIRWSYYMFMDHEDYCADSLFIQEKITVDFVKEYKKKGTPWMIMYVKVDKRDAARFEAAFDKLESMMLLKGHSDYPKAFEEIWVKGFLSGTESK